MYEINKAKFSFQQEIRLVRNKLTMGTNSISSCRHFAEGLVLVSKLIIMYEDN